MPVMFLIFGLVSQTWWIALIGLAWIILDITAPPHIDIDTCQEAQKEGPLPINGHWNTKRRS